MYFVLTSCLDFGPTSLGLSVDPIQSASEAVLLHLTKEYKPLVYCCLVSIPPLPRAFVLPSQETGLLSDEQKILRKSQNHWNGTGLGRILHCSTAIDRCVSDLLIETNPPIPICFMSQTIYASIKLAHCPLPAKEEAPSLSCMIIYPFPSGHESYAPILPRLPTCASTSIQCMAS